MINIDLNILKSCSSTNDIAKKEAIKGSLEGSSYLSYAQSNGRGRNKNKWESLEGNLFLSSIFRPKKNKIDWHQLSLLIGYSILETLIDFGINRNLIELKWPNDVLIDNKKISGILLEAFDNLKNINTLIINDELMKTECKINNKFVFFIFLKN